MATRTSTTRQALAGLRMLLVLTVVTGLVYPAAVWAVSWLGLRDQAGGSLVERDGQVVGSSLLGQDFTDAAHFHSRPSASDYSGDTSGGTNLAGYSPDQQDAVADRQQAYADTGTSAATSVPAPPDALTASASGLDPHISPVYALAQVDRVAEATGQSAETVRALVERHTQGRALGFLGQPRVNVLELNLALDAGR